MNFFYRLIWNVARQAWTVTHEAAASHGKAASPTRRLARALAGALIVGAAPAASAAPPAAALPTGGQVAAGQAAISQTGNAMLVKQDTSKVIINWQSFNIGSQASVTFQQPDSSSLALNRVVGSDSSAIYGKLSSNGQVFLVNPNGVLFGPGARVDVGGLVASSLDIADGDFQAGRYRFNRNGATGSVINQSILSGNYIALLAPDAENQGTITARMGTVALAAGEAVTLNITGQTLVDVQVDRASIDALVANKSLIQVEGGTALLTARSVSGLLGQVVNTGEIDASAVTGDGGTIRLTASARIDQSGTLKADAGANGNGGRIKVIADLDNPDSLTRIDGTLSARGGSQSGDGGFIETSGSHLKIASTARIDTRATHGKFGQWLLDPVDFTVAAAGGDIDGATLGGLLDLNTVTIHTAAGADTATDRYDSVVNGTNGDIIINDSISWSAGNDLILSASRDIKFDSSATLTFGGAMVPNGAKIQIHYGQGGSGKAYAVNGSSFSGLGVIDDISGTRVSGSAVTPIMGITNAGGFDYLIGTWNVPVYVQVPSGGSSTYGDPLPAYFSLSSGGTAVNVSPIAGLPTWTWTGDTNGGTNTSAPAASYTSFAYTGGLSSPFYSSFAAGAGVNFTVTQRPITLTADNRTKTYGDVLALGTTAFSLTSGTMAFTETVTGVTLASTGNKAGTATTAANTYAGNITLSGATGANGFDAANYNITYTAGDLLVNKATLTYVADVKSITAGSDIPALTGTVTGFVNGETLAGATTGTLAFTTAATKSSPAASYAINGGGLAATNYNFVQAAGNATALTLSGGAVKQSVDIIQQSLRKEMDRNTGAATEFAAFYLLAVHESQDKSYVDVNWAVNMIRNIVTANCGKDCVNTEQILAWLGVSPSGPGGKPMVQRQSGTPSGTASSSVAPSVQRQSASTSETLATPSMSPSTPPIPSVSPIALPSPVVQPLAGSISTAISTPSVGRSTSPAPSALPTVQQQPGGSNEALASVMPSTSPSASTSSTVPGQPVVNMPLSDIPVATGTPFEIVLPSPVVQPQAGSTSTATSTPSAGRSTSPDPSASPTVQQQLGGSNEALASVMPSTSPSASTSSTVPGQPVVNEPLSNVAVATPFKVVVLPSPVSSTVPGQLVVNKPLHDVTVEEGRHFKFSLRTDAFATTNGDAKITLEAKMENGAPLPSWLKFDPQSGTFEGTPPRDFKGEVKIKVIARDDVGGEAAQTFSIRGRIYA